LFRKLKDIVWSFLNIIHIGGLVQLTLKSGLKEDGWFKSYTTKMSVDKKGNPIPWNTYPYIKFIEPRLKNNFDVFEFGSGSSTIWYASRVHSVKAVENDKNWFEKISKSKPENVELVHQNLTDRDKYVNEVANADKKYHLIIIDGRNRVEALKTSISNLREDGVIVFDNSDLPIYKEALNILERDGFKKIDFIGLSPITAHTNYTTIFYRGHNCLDL
jgi:precorrin-6B methylase 2